MYFKTFPYTYYTLYDDLSNVKLVTNITTRIKINDDVKNNLSVYDEYDIRDEDTPEILADKFYNNPELHWVILLYNDIIDPRFGWPLSSNNLKKYAQGKYSNINGIHHYEDLDEKIVNGNVFINSSSGFANLENSNVIINLNGLGTGAITSKISNSNVLVTVTAGGFASGDLIALVSNTQVNANITATTTISGIPVTNFLYEDRENERKRRIKILKAPYVDQVIRDFKRKLEL